MDNADRTSALAAPPERPGSHRTLLATGVIGGLCFAAMLAASFWVYDAVTEAEGVAGLDRPVLNAMMALRNPAANAAITAFTNFGQTLPMVTIGLLGTTALSLRHRRRSVWVLMLLAAAGSVCFTLIGKPVFARLRPPVADAVPPYETSYSFPSGHTLNATVVTGMLAYLTVWLARQLWIRIAAVIAATTWSIAMGLSRIYLGHHWLSDVIFAWLVGLAWLAFLVGAHQLLLRSPWADPASSVAESSTT
jgi:membrane-associated phospholipid phosphatase